MEIERPQKNRKATESGFSKCHTMKAQLLVELETGQIICTAVDQGKTHDFKLLKRSRLPFMTSQLCLADRGYQGFVKRHAAACTPTKKPRKQQLPKAEKQHNRV
ncbi:MAG: transposase [Chroococcidiopsidaceae cyanobacterium CP_BM_ER_R8_30]|nr:transposase [Chroococcidiopsidaceae cyanobacterium CP_BM_ER_R8_30]